MSIVALKRKSVIQYGSPISGKSPGGSWIPRGPGLVATNNNGFSINGPYRNKGVVGTSSAFSRSKTLFKGKYAVGWGGRGNQYYDIPLFNVNNAVVVPGTQYKYVKPSVLNNKGMLSTRYKWMSGQYPNYWVKNVYTGYLVDTASQGVYIDNKSSANMCKDLPNEDMSQYIQSVPRGCVNPQPYQEHIPSVNYGPKYVKSFCS
jgi:hypothetical protein